MGGALPPGMFPRLDPEHRYELLADDQAPRRKDRQYDLVPGEALRRKDHKRAGLARLVNRLRRRRG